MDGLDRPEAGCAQSILRPLLLLFLHRSRFTGHRSLLLSFPSHPSFADCDLAIRWDQADNEM